MLYKEYLLTNKVKRYTPTNQPRVKKEIRKYTTHQWQRLYEKGYRLKGICANQELLLFDMEEKAFLVIEEALKSEGL